MDDIGKKVVGNILGETVTGDDIHTIKFMDRDKPKLVDRNNPKVE
jgi:hypothetical protein